MSGNITHRVCLITLLGIILFFAGGCWDKRELDQLGIVSGTGVDLENGTIVLTAQLVKPGQVKSAGSASGGGEGGGGQGGGQKTTLVFESKAGSIFEAIRKATMQSSRKLYFSHNEVLILGKAAAEKGVQPLLDFFIRDPEPRPTQWLLVAEEKAGEILKAQPGLESTSASDLAHLMANSIYTSEVTSIRLQDFFETISGKSRAAVLPIVKLQSGPDTRRVILDGTAVFRGDRMIGSLNSRETRGLLWVKGRVKNGIIPLMLSPDGEMAEIEIVGSHGSLQSKSVPGGIEVKAVVHADGDLGDLMTRTDLVSTNGIKYLERLMGSAIRQEIRAAFRKAVQLQADIFGVGNSIYQDDPKGWSRLKSHWNELFSKTRLSIDVKAKLRLVGETTKPFVAH